MKTLLRALLMLLIVFPNNYSSAQSICQIQFAADTVGCAPVVILAKAIDPPGSHIAKRVWTLYRCTGSDTVNKTPSAPNPNYYYALDSSGCFCLRLVETDSNGAIYATSNCNIQVFAQPVINMTFSPTEGCAPFTVYATCNSLAGSGTINRLDIDWGCGSINDTSCPPQPIACTFTTPPCQTGYISPNVVIENTAGCFADSIFTNAIHLIPAPVAAFHATTQSYYCQTSTINDTLVADSTDPHLTYCWYVNSKLKQCGSSRHFIYNFPACNCCYDVGLTVRHPSGCADSVVYHSYICNSISPTISWSPPGIDTLCFPDTVTFTNTSPGITNLTWQLSGPDTFNQITWSKYMVSLWVPGTYTMTASGTYAPGCTGSKTAIVVVGDTTPAHACFSSPDTLSCKVPFTVHYSSCPCQGCNYNWSFPGGTPPSSASANPVIVYNSFGQYTPSLTVSNSTGVSCSKTLTKSNYIRVAGISPVIHSTSYKGCAPECFTLSNGTPLNLGPFSSVCWSFPGSATLSGGCADTLQRCITTPGCNTVRLRITTASGCVDSTTLLDTLCAGAPPHITMSLSPDTVCACTDTVKLSIGGDTFSYVKVYWGDGPGQYYYASYIPHVYCDTGVNKVCVVAFKDSCEGDSLCSTVTVRGPIPDFTFASSCHAGDTINFTNTSKGANSYNWKFSCTAFTDTSTSPKEVLPHCDTCSVTLDATDSVSGCTASKTKFIITACDTTIISPSFAQVCVGASTVFQNHSPGSAGTEWNFYCNPDSVVLSPGSLVGTNIYTTPGAYTVCMRNVTAGGCIDTAYASVNVCNNEAKFTFDTVCFPFPICFHDTSRVFCSPTSYQWGFGDGENDTAANPCHVYAQNGTYSVTLTVNSGGCIASSTRQVTVSNVVTLNYHVDTVDCPGVPLCITNTSSGSNLIYSWQAPGASPPSSAAAAPCFNYSGSGNYLIFFGVTSNNQCAVYDTIRIHVSLPQAGGYPDTNYVGCPNPPTVIHFTDTSKYADSSVIWYFGDSASSTAHNPSHIYSVPGNYLVCLVATDKMGCSDSVCVGTVVVGGPGGSITVSPLPGICACKDSLHFTISTYNASGATLLWGCNTGYTSINPISPVGTRLNPTIFHLDAPFCLLDSCQPQLLLSDNAGCTVLLPLRFIYIDSPQVKISYHASGACNSGTVCFHDSTKYHLQPWQSYTVSRVWDFGDGITNTVANPCHYYAQPGAYHVKLYVHSNLGCFDSTTATINVVEDVLLAGYYVTGTAGCAEMNMCFHDTSHASPFTHIWYRVWNFGDGTPADTIYTDTICHAYTSAGYYMVSLCVYDSLGCKACDTAVNCVVIEGTSDVAPSNMLIYPNPANNTLTIDMRGSDDEITSGYKNIIIYNSFGQAVLSKPRGDENKITIIGVSALPDGIYLAALADAGMVKRVIGKFGIAR